MKGRYFVHVFDNGHVGIVGRLNIDGINCNDKVWNGKEWEENNRITGAAHYDMDDGDYDGVTKEGMEICLRNWHRQMSKEDYAKYKVEIIN